MAIAPSDMNCLLIGLCRSQIEAADLAREIAPTRTLQAAAYKQACAEAALATLRHAILLREREPARAPLRAVATRLGIALDDADEGYPSLALRALEAMREAGGEACAGIAARDPERRGTSRWPSGPRCTRPRLCVLSRGNGRT